MMKEFTQKTNLQMGFGLFELVIVLALIAGLGAMMVPNLFRNQAMAEKKQFMVDFKKILQVAVKSAVYESKVVQVYCNFENHEAVLKEFDPESNEDSKHKKFKLFSDTVKGARIVWPENVEVKNFVVNQKDEVLSSAKLQDVWFYVMPDGTAQPVTVNCVYQNDLQERDTPFSFVISPFYAKVKFYEEFQKTPS